MSALDFPRVDTTELALQQLLNRCRREFTFSDYELALTIAPPTEGMDLTLCVQWQGLPLRFFCQGALLAHWLKPHLQEADFHSLPAPLQLALLEREGQSLGTPLFTQLLPGQPATPCAGMLITLSRGDDRLALWLESDPTALMRQLPERPVAELSALPLQLSLQRGPVLVTPAELHTVATGDVLLLPSRQSAPPHLLGVVESRAWAHFHQHDTQLELIAMYSDDLTEQPTETLSDLDQIPVKVSFEVGRQTLDLHSLAALQPGSLIDLATPLTGEVRILVNQRCLGVGELVNIQDRLGIRVSRLWLGTAE